MPRNGANVEPVAVVGMSCRFPGGPDIETFWKLLESGGNAIIDAPATRWNLEALKRFNDGKDLPRNVTRGGWLPRVRDFDNSFFRMSPREARTLDPKQRLVLEVTYEAFEDANLGPDQLDDHTTGVFVGTAQSEYLMRFYNRMEIGTSRSDRYVGPGNDCSFTSGRISAMFGFDGPSVNVNTACSTSLVAVHMAIRAIQNGECDLAAAGGVSIIQSPEHSLTMNQFGVLAPDSQCKAFDASADGYVRAEGCGVVVLRSLASAKANGDRILAVLTGSAVNHNGLSDNIMAPDTSAQSRLLRSALEVGGTPASSVDLIEAHGTGTSVGDPIEIRALEEVFGHTGRTDPVYVGSVKTNIGHLEVGAGVAGLIKTILALHHKRVPKHLHLTKLNKAIPTDLPFRYPGASETWAKEGPRRAAVNSFGISGTNAAVVLEEGPAQSTVEPENIRPIHLLTLSAFGDQPMSELAGSYADLLESGADLTNVAYTAATGRSHHPTRMALVVDSREHAISALRAVAEGQSHPDAHKGDARGSDQPVAFLFTGQGSQFPGMGKELYTNEPVFRAAVDSCDAGLQPHLGRSIKAVMFGEDPAADVTHTQWTQPALFTLEYGLAQLWRSWGVEPALMIGHSIGELVAACIGGVYSLEDGLALVAARGKLMGELPTGGAMAAIFASVDDVRAEVEPRSATVSIAADNGPTSTTISGTAEDVEAICATFEAREVGVRRLTVSHAFHSHLMDPMLEAFSEVAGAVEMKAPSVPLISNVSGTEAGSEIATPEYWVSHVRGTVRFREAVEQLASRGIRLIIEIGPQAALTGQARRCVPKHRASWLGSLRKEQPYATLMNTLADLYVAGGPISWRGVWAQHRATRVDLPRYPFQRRPFWVEDPGPVVPSEGGVASPTAPPALTSGTAHTFDRPDHYRHRWMPITSWQSTPASPGTWIVGLDSGGVGEAAAKALEAAGNKVVRVVAANRGGDLGGGRTGLVPHIPDGYRELASAQGPALRGWLHCWSLDVPHSDDHDATAWTSSQDLSSLSAMFVAQAMIGSGVAGAGPWLVTRGADAVHAGESPALGQSGVWGVMRVVGLEHRNLPNIRIDLDPRAADGGAADLVTLLARPPSNEDQLAFRGGRAYAQRLVPHTPTGQAIRPDAEGAWLVTGGLGSLGLAVAEWLVGVGARKLILCGRSAPKPVAQQTIARMEAAGAIVLVEAVDISDAQQVKNLFHYVARKGVPIRGVIHAAGVLADGPVLQQDRDRFYRVFPAKVGGAWNLHKATEGLDLDAFVLFSSVSSSLGAPGQVNYAAANSFMDALAWYRHARGLPAVSMNWGPWGEIGMAAKLSALMASRGMGGIPTAAGLAALGASGADLVPQVTFMDMKVPTILQRDPSFGDAPLVREIMRQMGGDTAGSTIPTAPAAATAPAPAPVAASFLDQLRATAPAQRAAMVNAQMGSMAEAQLGVDPGSLNPGRPLAWQGFDSVMALDLHRGITDTFSVDLDLQAVTVGPSIAELSELVMSRIDLPSAAVPLPAAAAPLAAAAAPALGATPAPHATPALAAPAGVRGRLAAAPADQRNGILLAALAGWSEQLLGSAPGELDPKRPLAWQGFDSVMAVDLHKRISDETGVDMTLDHLVTGPKLTEVVEELLPSIHLAPPAAPAPVAPAPVAPAQAAPPAPAAGLIGALVTAPPAQREQVLLTGLCGFAEQLLGSNPGDLDPKRPLAWQGFDSVMAVDLHKRIADELGVDLPLDDLVSGPKLTEVAEDLLGRIDLTGVAIAPTAPAAAAAPAVAASGLAARLSAAAPTARPQAVLDALVGWSEQLLGSEPGDLDPKRPLAWQGFDSVMAVDLHKRISDETGVDLPLDSLVSGPKLTEVAEELVEKIDFSAMRAPAAAPATQAAPAPAAPPPAHHGAPAAWSPPPTGAPSAPPPAMGDDTPSFSAPEGLEGPDLSRNQIIVALVLLAFFGLAWASFSSPSPGPQGQGQGQHTKGKKGKKGGQAKAPPAAPAEEAEVE